MQLFLLPSSCSCCHVAVHHTLICSYSHPVFECGYSCYHPASPCHHVAILAAVRLFLPSCDYSCCHAAINYCHVDIFLLPCSYSCHHVAILTALQPLIVAVWIYSCCHAVLNCCHVDIFLLPCSYSCHNVAILAAKQPFLPPCGYYCYPAAVIPAIYVASLASIPSDYTI